MNERSHRRQWDDPTAKIAIERTDNISQLEERIARIEDRPNTKGQKKAAKKELRYLRRLRNRLVWAI